MRSFATAALAAVVSLSNAANIFELHGTDSNSTTLESDASPAIYKNSFGHMVEETVLESGEKQKKVRAPLLPLHMDYTQQEHHIR